MSETEILWDADDGEGAEIELKKTHLRSGYQISVFGGPHSGLAIIDLDKKHLKDLFNAIGNEINAF